MGNTIYTTFQELDNTLGDKEFPLTGVNSEGELVIYTAGKNEELGKFFKVATHQPNGWIRTNIYYEDGTLEELYSR